MARKMKTRTSRVTVAAKKKKPEVTDLGKSFVELKAARDAYNRSHTAYHIEELADAIDSNSITLAPWEIEAMNNLIEKFNTKYNSPLAKVMR
jgi:hypothetical protein